jgi:hypothetical protein
MSGFLAATAIHYRFGLFIIDLSGIKTFSIGVTHPVSFLRRNRESSLVAVTGIRLLTHQAGLHAGYLILPVGLLLSYESLRCEFYGNQSINQTSVW